MVAYDEFANSDRSQPTSATYDKIEERVSQMFKVETQLTINRKRKQRDESFGTVSTKTMTVRDAYEKRGAKCRQQPTSASPNNDSVDITRMQRIQRGHRGSHQDNAYLMREANHYLDGEIEFDQQGDEEEEEPIMMMI